MALKKCPECNKDVSSESIKCIHCGYHLKKSTIINNKEYDLSYELDLVLNNKKIEAIKSVREKTGLGLADGKSVIDYMVEHKKCPMVFNFVEPQSQPKCPTCSSTNIKKISGTKRWLSVGIFGVSSSDLGKSMQCNSCGYKW